MAPTSIQTEDSSTVILQDNCAGETAHSGRGSSQPMGPVRSDAELEKLGEAELKAAIKSSWKKHERLAKKDMAPLLYWLRIRLRAQGSRTDLPNKDRGFGAWVNDNLDISLSTAIRWADVHARQIGAKVPMPRTDPNPNSDPKSEPKSEPKSDPLPNSSPNPNPGLQAEQNPTSCQTTISGSETVENKPYEDELNQRPVPIQFTYRVSQTVHGQYTDSLKIIRKHLKLTDDREAVVKGVVYAAEAIITQSQTGNGSVHATPTGRPIAGRVSDSNGD